MVFKYLGRVLTESDDDWTSVVANMRKAQRWWSCLPRILWREGADPQTSGTFYKVVVQVTLLFGVETWFMTPSIGINLGSFYQRVARQLEVMQMMQYTTVRWFYPPLEAAMTPVGLEEVEKYVLFRHITITQYILTRLIMKIYLAEEGHPGV